MESLIFPKYYPCILPPLPNQFSSLINSIFSLWFEYISFYPHTSSEHHLLFTWVSFVLISLLFFLSQVFPNSSQKDLSKIQIRSATYTGWKSLMAPCHPQNRSLKVTSLSFSYPLVVFCSLCTFRKIAHWEIDWYC